MEDVASWFYKLQLFAVAANWLLAYAGAGKPLWSTAHGSTATRPSWLPVAILSHILRKRKALFLVVPVLCACAGWVGDLCGSLGCLTCRWLAAIGISLYHLAETSITNRHGEFVFLYNAWAMALPVATSWRHALSFGIAVHFVLSTGWSKVSVGGFDPLPLGLGVPAWLRPSTMRTYLRLYRGARSGAARPALEALSRWMSDVPVMCSLLSMQTLVFEVIFVPAVMFLDAEWRNLAAVLMLLMHVGIFALMSKAVGSFFVTAFPSYVIGFTCRARPFVEAEWWLAFAVGVCPTLFVALSRCLAYGTPGSWTFEGLLPEDWPLSNCALFMWSGAQAQTLADVGMVGKTRIVMATEDVLDPCGLPVLAHGVLRRKMLAASETNSAGSAFCDRGAVHSTYMRVISFTILHPAHRPCAPRLDGSWDVPAFVTALDRWLKEEHRCFEVEGESTIGKPLCRAWLVEVDLETDVVTRILAGPQQRPCH